MTKTTPKTADAGRDPPGKNHLQVKKDAIHEKSGPRAPPPRPRQTNPKTS